MWVYCEVGTLTPKMTIKLKELDWAHEILEGTILMCSRVGPRIVELCVQIRDKRTSRFSNNFAEEFGDFLQVLELNKEDNQEMKH